ncbi:hypothetical protein VIGAN_09187300 [Vigna angularis var. angularis]|uniref:Uncharacterized protein n=1 Tax=Vigna angularis var. angularis TaxID=157739 RepID=A0A0S3SZH9_PHAAN|nr:hypothetical protein VIGAN_09187300 [Vigna angularis var. angularis]
MISSTFPTRFEPKTRTQFQLRCQRHRLQPPRRTLPVPPLPRRLRRSSKRCLGSLSSWTRSMKRLCIIGRAMWPARPLVESLVCCFRSRVRLPGGGWHRCFLALP